MRRNIAILALVMGSLLAVGFAPSASAQLVDKKALTLAEAEGLDAHARSIAARLNRKV